MKIRLPRVRGRGVVEKSKRLTLHQHRLRKVQEDFKLWRGCFQDGHFQTRKIQIFIKNVNINTIIDVFHHSTVNELNKQKQKQKQKLKVNKQICSKPFLLFQQPQTTPLRLLWVTIQNPKKTKSNRSVVLDLATKSVPGRAVLKGETPIFGWKCVTAVGSLRGDQWLFCLNGTLWE